MTPSDEPLWYPLQFGSENLDEHCFSREISNCELGATFAEVVVRWVKENTFMLKITTRALRDREEGAVAYAFRVDNGIIHEVIDPAEREVTK